nr:unnamed protein product [Salmo salar]
MTVLTSPVITSMLNPHLLLVYADLWKTGMFERMSLQTDEDEHSIEMHLPYTAKAMESHKDELSIVPVLVGALSESKDRIMGNCSA